MNVSVRELRLHLSDYLMRVRRGETVVVTERGSPVARLEPVPPVEPPAAVAQLVAAGLLSYKPPPRVLAPRIQMLPGEKTSTDYVREQRR